MSAHGSLGGGAAMSYRLLPTAAAATAALVNGVSPVLRARQLQQQQPQQPAGTTVPAASATATASPQQHSYATPNKTANLARRASTTGSQQQFRRDSPANRVGDVSMDQVKLLFGSIDVQSVGYITRWQFEETLHDAGISLNDARLEEVKKRLLECERKGPLSPVPCPTAATPTSPGTAALRYGSPNGSKADEGDSKRRSSLSSRGAAASVGGEEDGGGAGRIDLAKFAYIIAPNASLIERVIKRQLVIPDWASFVQILTDLYDETRDVSGGKVADYIPELALAQPEWFGVSFCSVDGQLFSLGDTAREFSVQSSSKPISYLMALEELGEEVVHRFVGREPSGRNFNDIALNPEQIPHNPMVNSGAIMTCSLIRHGLEQSARFRSIMDLWNDISGRGKYVTFSNSTYLSERATADRNFCLGYMMQEHDSFNLGSTRMRHLPPREWGANDLVKNLELYFQCCSIQTSAEGQAVIGATLASGGRCALTDQQCFSGAHVRNCLSLMLSCGMYDYSGEWAYKIGLPAKSGVSGCLMVVIPNVGGLSIYSPPLDALGNTVRGIAFCKRLVEKCCFSSFASTLSNKYNPISAKNSAWQNELITLCTLCAKGDLTGIRAVLSAGADANGADYDGRTPLHLAASEGQLAVVKYLCATSKLKLNPVDRWGGTPFSDAVREGHAQVAEYLFAKLKAQGITPMPTATNQQQQQQQQFNNSNKPPSKLFT